MKPDIEINGRYFVEGNIIKNIIPTLNSKNIRKNGKIIVHRFQTEQSLPLGKCWVELDRFKVQPSNPPQDGFRIKLDQQGKAVVLTELPKEEINSNMIQVIQQTDEEKMVMYMRLPKEEIISMLIQCNKILDNKKIEVNETNQSPDELAEEVLKQKESLLSYLNTYPKWMKEDIIKTMQEYHRRMKDAEASGEGMFTAFDMMDFSYWTFSKMKDNSNYFDNISDAESLNQWLESRKEKK